jgi:hypothetical protein
VLSIEKRFSVLLSELSNTGCHVTAYFNFDSKLSYASHAAMQPPFEFQALEVNLDATYNLMGAPIT